MQHKGSFPALRFSELMFFRELSDVSSHYHSPGEYTTRLLQSCYNVPLILLRTFATSRIRAFLTTPALSLPHDIPTQTNPTDPRSAFAVASLELVLDTVGLITLGALVRLWEVFWPHLFGNGYETAVDRQPFWIRRRYMSSGGIANLCGTFQFPSSFRECRV
jgi:hypothetical protein